MKGASQSCFCLFYGMISHYQVCMCQMKREPWETVWLSDKDGDFSRHIREFTNFQRNHDNLISLWLVEANDKLPISEDETTLAHRCQLFPLKRLQFGQGCPYGHHAYQVHRSKLCVFKLHSLSNNATDVSSKKAMPVLS